MFVAGCVLLIGTLGPIVYSQLNFYLTDTRDLLDPSVISTDIPLVATGFTDYTQVANWFTVPNKPQILQTPKVSRYTVSFPSINLVDVPVEIYGSDLGKNAIQYSGTALPGALGNPVIFGHSTLAQLYKPNDPYSIFNHLPQVKVGDEITVNYDGFTYKYIIRDTREVKPTQISVLDQRYDRREITIITCVPLGTYLRRFVARAELVK
jgi:sortase A